MGRALEGVDGRVGSFNGGGGGRSSDIISSVTDGSSSMYGLLGSTGKVFESDCWVDGSFIASLSGEFDGSLSFVKMLPCDDL